MQAYIFTQSLTEGSRSFKIIHENEPQLVYNDYNIKWSDDAERKIELIIFK